MRYTILALAALLAGAAQARTEFGYSDNKCTLNTVNLSLEDQTFWPDYGGTPQMSTQVTRNYRLSCADGVQRNFQLFTYVQYIATSARYDMASNRILLDGYRYGADEQGNWWNENGTWHTWPVSESNHDGNDILSVTADYWWLSSTPQPPEDQLERWTDWRAAGNAAVQHAEYNRTRFQVEPLFSREFSAFPFDATRSPKEDPETTKPRAIWKIKSLDDPRYFATVFCFPGANDNNWFNKPLIVGDAFDPFSERTAQAIYFKNQYSGLLKLDASTPRGRGYDVFFVDFSQGGGNLHINAMINLKLIEHLKTKTSAKVVVGGLSMGGILARMALLYSLPANNSTRTDLAKHVKGYLSVDSPHQGANVAPDVLNDIYDLLGTTLVKFDDAKFTLRRYRNMMNCPAAHQMLYQHFYEEVDRYCTPPGYHTPGSCYPIKGTKTDGHDAFYGFLAAKGGYRADVPKVAIAYSNFQVPHPGYTGSTSETVNRMGDMDAGIWRLNAGNSYEFLPGSTGDWYYSSYSGKDNKNMYPVSMTSGGPKFKGTFVPIVSALDLRNFDSMSPPTQEPAAMKKYSPFDAVYFMTKPNNGYCTPGGTCGYHSLCEAGPANCRSTQEDKRYEHLIMDKQLVTTIVAALDRIEGIHAGKWLPTLLTLLQN